MTNESNEVVTAMQLIDDTKATANDRFMARSVVFALDYLRRSTALRDIDLRTIALADVASVVIHAEKT